MPMENVTDCPASARDFPAVATSLVAISDPGANLILKSFSITSSLTLSRIGLAQSIIILNVTALVVCNNVMNTYITLTLYSILILKLRDNVTTEIG